MLARLTIAMAALALLVFAAAFVLARTERDDAPATAGAAGLERVTVSGPAKVSGLAAAVPLPEMRRPPSATPAPEPTATTSPAPSATVAPEPAPTVTAAPAPSAPAGGGGGGDTPVGGGGGGG